MKKIIVASVLAMGLMSTTASAEVNVGLGLAVGASNATEAAGIRVPIDFDFGLRLEPELGFAKDIYTLAFGAYYTFMKVEEVNLFAGGRLGYTNVSSGPIDFSGTSLQALVGAEYFVVPNRFSIAAQVGLENATGGLNKSNNYGNTTFGTTGALIGHYFF